MVNGFYNAGAHYTIHIYDLLENGFFSAGKSPLENYPIWNETYREYINDMIIQYFMMWEIGYETEHQFWFALHAKMLEIMPRLNILFKSRHLDEKYDPLLDHDYEIEHTEEGTLESTDNDTDTKTSQEKMDDGTTEKKTSGETMKDTVDTTGETKGKYNTITRDSDTPQQNLNNLGYGYDDSWINQWLTHGQIVNNDHEDRSTAHSEENKQTDYTHNITGTDERTTDYSHTIQNDRTIDTDTTRHYLQHYSGRRTSGQELAIKLSELAFDLETQIIDSLKPLFMGLYYD